MKAAKLENKDNWVKYRRSMKKARAVTECIREACPEVLMGATYTPDELGANTDELGEPIDLQQVPTTDAGPNVSRETRPETPIVDEPVAAPTDGDAPFDWANAIATAASKTEVGDLYQKARLEGMLTVPITIGKDTHELGQYIIMVGQAFAEAEAAEPAAEATVEPDEGAPAVLADDDPNVVDAEVVDEPAPKPRARRTAQAPKADEDAPVGDR
jgi:hypothetical protein